MGAAARSGKKSILCSDRFSHGSLGASTAVVACVATANSKAIVFMCVPETNYVFSAPWEHGGVITHAERDETPDSKRMPSDEAHKTRVMKALEAARPVIFDESLPASAFKRNTWVTLQSPVVLERPPRLRRPAAAAEASASAASAAGAAAEASAAAASAAGAAAATARSQRKKPPGTTGGGGAHAAQGGGANGGDAAVAAAASRAAAASSKKRDKGAEDDDAEDAAASSKKPDVQFEVGDYVCKRDGTVSRVAEQSTWNWAVTESARKVRKASPSLTTLLSPTRGARLYAERQAAAHAASTKKAAEAASASALEAASKSAADAASKSTAQAASVSDTMNRSTLADVQRQFDEQRRQLDEERRTNERLQREQLVDATAPFVPLGDVSWFGALLRNAVRFLVTELP